MNSRITTLPSRAVGNFLTGDNRQQIEDIFKRVVNEGLDFSYLTHHIEVNELVYLFEKYLNPIDFINQSKLIKVIFLGDNNYQFVFDNDKTSVIIDYCIDSISFLGNEGPQVFRETKQIHPEIITMLEKPCLRFIEKLHKAMEDKEEEMKKTLNKRFSW